MSLLSCAVPSSTKLEQWAYFATEDNPAEGILRVTCKANQDLTGLLYQSFSGNVKFLTQSARLDNNPELHKACMFNAKARDNRSLLD